MHIVVCIKQVPDTTQVRIDPVTNTLMRQGVPSIINPYDLFAIEEALRLKDKFGSKVTAIGMCPPQAKDALKKAISYGVDEAILITDRSFAGADTLATSYVLARAIERINANEPVDFVFCGKQTIDGDTAQVGPGIARRLGFSLLSYVEKLEYVDIENREVVVIRRAEGARQRIKSKLPCLITVLEHINELRYAPLPNLFKAIHSQVLVWDKKTIEADERLIGLKGSPTIVRRVFAPTVRGRGDIINNGTISPQELAKRLVENIYKTGVI